MKRLFTLNYNPILMPVVEFLVPHMLHRNDNRFKAGDQVRYGWFAKVFLGDIIRDLQQEDTTLVIREVINNAVTFTDDLRKFGHTHVFWLRKAYPWERVTVVTIDPNDPDFNTEH